MCRPRGPPGHFPNPLFNLVPTQRPSATPVQVQSFLSLFGFQAGLSGMGMAENWDQLFRFHTYQPAKPTANRRQLEAIHRQLWSQFHFSWGPGGPQNHARWRGF